MLSVCIPIYNFDVRPLVHALHRQVVSLKTPCQILLMDDASDETFRLLNREISSLQGVEYVQLENNLGRTGIRNKLADMATYRFLLFMDCDSQIVTEKYLENYLPHCQSNIVCSGGRLYPDEPTEQEYRLHWTVGTNRETASAEIRNRCPNKGFMTCNFLIDKEIFRIIRFDERLKGYGHEDTLFGIELSRLGITVRHIDNPLRHIGLERGEIFLRKNENGIRNLLKIGCMSGADPLFEQAATIVQVYNKLHRWHLTSFFALAYRLSRKPVRKNLLGKTPVLRLFDFYKLGYMCHASRQNNV